MYGVNRIEWGLVGGVGSGWEMASEGSVGEDKDEAGGEWEEEVPVGVVKAGNGEEKKPETGEATTCGCEDGHAGDWSRIAVVAHWCGVVETVAHH